MLDYKALVKYRNYRSRVQRMFMFRTLAKVIILGILTSGLIINTLIILKDDGLKEFVRENIMYIQSIINSKLPVQKSDSLAAVEIVKQSANDSDIKENTVDKTKYEETLNKLKSIEQENLKLKEDNVSLQNTIKIVSGNGTKPLNYKLAPPVTARSGIIGGKYIGEFTVTAYTPSADECGNNLGLTASGHPIVAGTTVAVDTNYWPVGTIFYVKGLGYVIAMDTGGAIKGKYRFDFAVFDKKVAKEIGVRKYEVFLIKKGNGKIEDIKF